MRNRVFLVSDSPYFVPPFTAGGTETQLVQLAQRLRDSGVPVSILARAPAHPYIASAAHAKTPMISYIGPAGEQRGKAWAALLPNLLYVVRVFGSLIARRASYDILLVSGFRLLSVPAGLAARLLGKTCIVRIEDANDLTFTLSAESRTSMGGFGLKMMLAIVHAIYWSSFRLADKIVAFTNQIDSRLRDMGASPAKIEIIPNGIDTQVFHPIDAGERIGLRARLNLPEDALLFVYTGRLTRSKGVMDLMTVWVELVTVRSDVRLVLLGDEGGGPDGCEAEARHLLAARGAEESVLFCGSVRNVSEYLQCADAFLSLSHGETFGMSLVEALTTGLPSVVSTVGIAQGIGGPQPWGWAVPVGAPPQIPLQALHELLAAQPQWPQLAQAAQRESAKYSIESVTAQYRALFERVGRRRE